MRKKNIKVKTEKIADAFELPKDILLDIPKVTVFPEREAEIVNYGGIVQYDEKNVRVNTKYGMISVEGENLDIKSISDEAIFVVGKILKVEF